MNSFREKYYPLPKPYQIIKSLKSSILKINKIKFLQKYFILKMKLRIKIKKTVNFIKNQIVE